MADQMNPITRAYDPPEEQDIVDPVEWNAELDSLVNAHNTSAATYNETIEEYDGEHASMSESISGNTAAIGVINTNVTNNTTQIGLNGAAIQDNADDIAQNASDIDAVEQAVGLLKLTAYDLTAATLDLDSTYEDYNAIICRYVGETVITLRKPSYFNDDVGRRYFIIAADDTSGVKVLGTDFINHGGGETLYLRPGETLQVALAQDSSDSYGWAVVSHSEDLVKVERLAPSAATNLTKYDKKMQYIKAYDPDTSVVLPTIDSTMDGREFVIMAGGDGGTEDLKVTADTSAIIDESGEVTQLDLTPGEAAHVVAVSNHDDPSAGIGNRWVVISNTGGSS